MTLATLRSRSVTTMLRLAAWTIVYGSVILQSAHTLIGVEARVGRGVAIRGIVKPFGCIHTQEVRSGD